MSGLFSEKVLFSQSSLIMSGKEILPALLSGGGDHMAQAVMTGPRVIRMEF